VFIRRTVPDVTANLRRPCSAAGESPVSLYPPPSGCYEPIGAALLDAFPLACPKGLRSATRSISGRRARRDGDWTRTGPYFAFGHAGGVPAKFPAFSVGHIWAHRLSYVPDGR